MYFSSKYISNIPKSIYPSTNAFVQLQAVIIQIDCNTISYSISLFLEYRLHDVVGEIRNAIQVAQYIRMLLMNNLNRFTACIHIHILHKQSSICTLVCQYIKLFKCTIVCLLSCCSLIVDNCRLYWGRNKLVAICYVTFVVRNSFI